MGRFALGSLVWMAVLALVVGGALAADQQQTQLQTKTQLQTQDKLQTQSQLRLQDGECSGCDCPCGECLDCLQNRAGECSCWKWEGDPVDPWEQFMWQFQWGWED